MRRLRLTGTVRITGPDFWGRQSTLVIEPITDQTDYRWLWRWKYGHDVSVTPKLFRVGGFLGRCVVLVHRVDGKTYRFHEAEHIIGWLHALGVRGVCIWLEDSDWPPYMCQAQLRREIKNLLIPQLPLKPYQPQRSILSTENGKPRTVSYAPDHLRGLIVKANVNYSDERVGHHALEFWGGVDEDNLMKVLSARTLGKPQLLWPLAWVASKWAGWKGQSKKIVWGPGLLGQPTPSICQELAEHKVVDAGLYSFAAPWDSFLAGTINGYRNNHELDIRQIRELSPHDNVLELRKSA